jgi:hypothetical protein
MKEWVEKQWQDAQLGDRRLNARAIKIGEACLAIPDGSLPKKCGGWAETKTVYSFFYSEGVTLESLQEVHNKNVFEIASMSDQMVLFIQDGSEFKIC